MYDCSIHKANKYITVANVVDNNEYGDTYCFNRHKIEVFSMEF